LRRKDGYAGHDHATGRTLLAEGLMPNVHDIAAHNEFISHEVDQAQFEELWQRATRQ
jgi:hypothetical protein